MSAGLCGHNPYEPQGRRAHDLVASRTLSASATHNVTIAAFFLHHWNVRIWLSSPSERVPWCGVVKTMASGQREQEFVGPIDTDISKIFGAMRGATNVNQRFEIEVFGVSYAPPTRHFSHITS